MRIIVVLLLVTTTVAPIALDAQAVTVFKGRPAVRIIEDGRGGRPEHLKYQEATNLDCVISKIGDEYFWASRENRRLVKRESGAFIMFVEVNGAGYVKVIASGMKEAAALALPNPDAHDYVEHILLGIGSITYYGKQQVPVVSPRE